MASATKQLQQFARQLYTLSFDGRSLSSERVAGVLEFVDKHRPPHALALLKEVSLATGLLIPTDALREAAEQTDAELNEQLHQNTDNLEGVHQLEAQYDALVAERAEEAADSPSGVDTDNLAAQVEQFLAQMESRGKSDE